MDTDRKKIAVIGSRGWKDNAIIFRTLDLIREKETFELVSGGAIGVDSMAEMYAKLHGIAITVIKPDYKMYGSKVAPLIRNKKIVDMADQVIAFWDGQSMGTLHTINYASKSGKKLFVIKN